MKRLLLVGSESVHTFNYCKMVADYFDEVLVVTGKVNTNYPYKQIALNFSLKNPFSVLSSVKAIKKIVTDYKPSVVHIHQANSVSFITLLALKGQVIPTIITAWGSDILLADTFGWWHKKMLHYNLSNAGWFTSDSLFMASQMQSFIPSKNLDITIANFGVTIKDKQTVPKENIVYSNRLHNKLYRIDKILLAYKKFTMARANENWKLVIAAIGSETEALKKLAIELEISEQVIFPGFLASSENEEYYNKAKIFVSIPESDATSISLLEAMYSGCIPVVSNLPANGEWIIDGLNGIVAINLEENFLEKALSLEYNRVSEINQYLVLKKATKQVNASKFLSLYDKILAT